MPRNAFLLAVAALAALGACSTAPGTGWSRASDLSVYGSMQVFARAARDQDMLCAGFSRASTDEYWQRKFGDRQAAVTEALAARYGAAALAEADGTWAPRIACGTVPDPQWRQRYERQLRLLENRLQTAGEGEG